MFYANNVETITYLFLFCISLNMMRQSTQVRFDTINGTKRVNETLKEYNVSTISIENHHCTYRNMQHCLPYVRNIFLLYTGIGGWVFLGIVSVGILLQIHLVVTGRRREGMVALKRIDLKYEMAQMRRKKNSFTKKWISEMTRGRPASL